MNDPSLSGRRVTVMGLGLFGGGVAVTRHLARAGARVLVTDLRAASELRESLAAIADLGVALRLGEHREQDFVDTDLVVANPAVAPSSPWLAAARARGVAITSEFNLFLRACRSSQVLAVTGTNGKTTTATLLGDMLRSGGRRVFVGGNIGRSLLESLDEIEEHDTVVLEVSSYQLEVVDAPPAWPRVAAVTAISPDHLDRHGSMEAYAAAKRRIVEGQDAGGDAVLNAADPLVAPFAAKTRARVRWYSRSRADAAYAIASHAGAPWLVERLDGRTVPLAPLSALQLRGEFQRDNALAAAAAARAVELEPGAIEEALAAFRGVAHRLQPLAPVGGVRFIDNAVSTVPESTISAIEATEGPIRLLAGGKSKHLDLAALARTIARNVARTYAYGSAAGELEQAASAAGAADVVVAKTLSEAFGRAIEDARSGDAVLYSPAFPSYDQYRNFQDRGAEFLLLVERLRSGRG